jgi:hypothetical protein
MASAPKPNTSDIDPTDDLLPPYHEVTVEEGWEILERRSLGTLGMSAKEFVEKWESGEIDDPDRSEILSLAFLIPFVK